MIDFFTVDGEVGNEGGNIAQELRALLTRWLISLSGDCRPFRFVSPPPLIFLSLLRFDSVFMQSRQRHEGLHATEDEKIEFVVIVVTVVYVDTPLE